MKIKLLILLFLVSLSSFSQKNTLVDSLQTIVKNSANDSIIMETYNKLRRATYYSNPKESQKFTFKYLEFSKKRKDSFHTAIANFYLGNSYVVQSNYENALNRYLKSADYFEKRDSSRYSSVLNGIGAAYENSGNDSLSLKYFKKSQIISQSRGDLRRSAIALNNIGNIYKNRGEYQTAKEYMENAVADIETTGKKQYIIPLTINLANAYTDLNDFDKSLKSFKKILTQIDTIKDIYSYAATLRGLGTSNIAKGKNKLGLGYLKQAYKKYNSSDFFDERYDMMPDLINAYKLNNQYKKGLFLFDEYNAIKDSIFNTEKDKNLTEALQKYEVEKKDVELKLLKVEGEKNEQQKKLYSFIALAGILIAGLLGFFGYKNRKKNTILDKQKRMLEITLDEKNTLLKEVHHRVKNSFQIVSSLLYLQSENVDDKEAKIAIKEAENRVRSMVLIHQRLYNKDELVGINTQDYFSDLVRDVIESHQFKKEKIQYELKVEPMVLDIETTTPIGLILNELIVNTLKHAFEEVDENSKIIVIFAKEKNELVLKVIDNGKGFEGEIKSTSFGITLMKALSKKLKASLNYISEPSKGTKAILNIKKFSILS
ncbi:MAG: tetratricopeptide repeat protein [Flavobacteriaceae bacterium]|nr:tetratricopeptide repeat protein [Flavobacteriaceae bacterium]